MKIIIYKIYIYIICFFSLPLIMTVVFLLAVYNGLPILFIQKRVGKDGNIFDIYKFRTMKIDSELQKKKLRKHNEANGPVFKIKDDPRFTKIGKFLAHTGLDELPQLWNVLKGDMTLIGPRPLPVEEAAKLKPWQKKRHALKPGIISPWILQGYHSMSFDDWMKSDIEYIKNKSYIYDAKIGLQTCFFLFKLCVKELQKLLS